YAETNVMGEEIIIYDDNFTAAPNESNGDLSNKGLEAKDTYNNNFGLNNSTSKKLGNGQFDDTLESSIQTLDNDQTEVINTVNDDLWQRIKNGYAIPNSTSGLTTKHENWYSSRPDYMKRMVDRSQKYLFHIVEEVEKRGMPTEIALLPMIESAYNPQAYSTSRASGIWQFIPSTGKHFGLKQNWWVDNRRNVTAATDAALTYLQKLHGMFGAWDLALAAYNAGEGTIGRAIKRNRELGLPTNYESLNLPPETRNYVPKLQAIKNLMTNPNNYGLQIQTIANSAYFSKVSAPAQIDAHLAAKLAGISNEEFTALNPGYNRPVIASIGDKHELLLPIAAAQTFKNNLASYNKPLVSWQTYRAKRGERMDKIADKFGIQVAELRTVNNLPAQKKIKSASTILVPNGNKADFNPTKNTSSIATPSEGKNSEGNNLSTDQNFENLISKNQDLENQNLGNQDSENIDLTTAQNDVLTNNDNADNNNEIEPAKYRSVTHKVKKGERMQTIANRYGISVKQIMASNSLKNSRVNTGQVLTIKNIAANTKVASNSTKNPIKVASNNKDKKKTYTVKRGDTLHSIAQKFDVAITDIKRWNRNVTANIQPGHKLTIHPSNAA
ncbi:MAG TPA: LysM peptidoglycan-binding domain-containing protein, partial [Methylotenera sp.]|nr:LysM peptidoglycan-binding domain-containing protein [Methylotenera sp.]